MYLTHNEEKSVIAKKFIRTLKKKIYQYMTPKNVYIDKLDDIANKYNNTYHSTIKMKPVGVKWNTYIDSCKKINDKNPKFKIGDTVRLSKHINIFAKDYTSYFSEKFLSKKVKNTVPWTYVINDLNEDEIARTFYEH